MTCSARGCELLFDQRRARRDAERYRKKGLDATALRMVEFLRARGVAGRSVLEVGGGIGAIQLEVLKAGAARAVNVEIAPAYEPAARDLAREAGVEEQAGWILADFAERPDAVEPADAVVMHKVVCCYPDYEALMTAAAERAREALVLSFPREAWWVALLIWIENAWHYLRRRSFRAYLHPPGAMLAAAERHGLTRALEHRGVIWEIAGLTRP